MSRVFHDAFRELDTVAGVLGAGLVDANGHVIHAVGAHGGRDPEPVAVHLPRPAPSGLERALGARFEEEVLTGAAGSLLLRRFGDRRFVVYALVDPGHPLGPVRVALAECGERLAGALLRGTLPGAERQRLEDLRQFAPGSRLGEEL